MSRTMQAYVPAVDDTLVPRWLERLDALDMRCELHPGFSFATHSGFLPFKVRLTRAPQPALADRDWLTGFEFRLGRFDLAEELDAEPPPKATWLERLQGRQPRRPAFASTAIDPLLARCKQVVDCTWSGADSLELRMATLSAAILAELTGGVLCDAAENRWSVASGEVERALAAAQAHEASIPPEQLRLHPFEGWR